MVLFVNTEDKGRSFVIAQYRVTLRLLSKRTQIVNAHKLGNSVYTFIYLFYIDITWQNIAMQDLFWWCSSHFRLSHSVWCLFLYRLVLSQHNFYADLHHTYTYCSLRIKCYLIFHYWCVFFSTIWSQNSRKFSHMCDPPPRNESERPLSMIALRLASLSGVTFL